jgi:Peptidase family C25/FlgD Ig-like domain
MNFTNIFVQKKQFILAFILFNTSFTIVAFAQQSIVTTHDLQWKSRVIEKDFLKINTATFQNASWEAQTPTLPHFYHQVAVNNYGKATVEILNPMYEPFTKTPTEDDKRLSANIDLDNQVVISRKDYAVRIHFIPIRKTTSGYERLVRFQLKTTLYPTPLPTVKVERGGPTTNSVLKEGTFFKFAIENTGIQRIDGKLLKEAGADLSKIDPKKIKVYGNAGGMLPERNIDFRYDDLVENPCIVNGENDGKFDESDNITFFAVAADKWYFDAKKNRYNMKKNVYSNNSFYFIKIDGDNGKRIANEATITSAPDYTTKAYSDYQRFEQDKLNLLDKYESTPGGGQQWYGEDFLPSKKSAKIVDFSFPNIVKNSTANVQASLAYRATSGGSFNLTIDNQSYEAFVNGCGACNEDVYTYAAIGNIDENWQVQNDILPVSVNIESNQSNMRSYFDYVQVNVRRQLIPVGQQMLFRDVEALDKNIVAYELSNISGWNIWNVSEPTNPKNIVFSNGSFLSRQEGKEAPEEFIAFSNTNGFLIPKAIGKTENQDLHGLSSDVEMVVIHSKALATEAQRLSAHRAKKSNLKIANVLVDHIYNEFSSGALDPTAIRDFVKLLYEKNKNFKYVLLFGDGSFNYRNIGVGAEEIAKNHIPPYETYLSNDIVDTYPSDDYYALLSPNEGVNLSGGLDVAVGRITASDIDMAKVIVDKIINYDNNPEAMRDFRNRMIFVADDYDESLPWEEEFLTHSEDLDEEAKAKYKNMNSEKVYLSAFPQYPTPSGPRSPDANQAINNNIFKGALVLNYIGHGGPRGWAQERILNASTDIPTWSNYDRLPLFITATCSFGAYDDPNDNTAGEQVLALDKGGAVALYSTVRAVFNADNNLLTRAVFDVIYEKNGYNGQNMGDILTKSKNNTFASESNTRKFALLGDPSQRLALPQYEVLTTKINGKDITATTIDTIGALQKLSVEGIIADSMGNVLTNFNGKVYPTIYDKTVKLTTLPIGGRTQDYKLQNKILFRGTANVVNGKFKFSCVIPKDINYDYGFAKISFYANNGTTDAAGSDNTHIVIGGIGKDAIKDEKPPIVEVFMDNEQFVSGGIVSPNPTLVVKITDDYGINVSGTSVGHDPLATLDNDTKKTYRLNDFYQSEPDEPAKGRIEYPLFKLSEGQHEIKVKAWDISNNSAEGSTTFVVAANGKTALEHVLNYPNPFTTSTNFQFRHHLSEINVKVMVQIFTVSGRLVKTIETDATSRGGVVTDVAYDGKDDYGSDLAKGVYIYKVKIRSVRNANIQEEGDFQKMVILK